MSGSVLWATAGEWQRELMIRLACDADHRHSVKNGGAISGGLTIAQALEVLK